MATVVNSSTTFNCGSPVSTVEAAEIVSTLQQYYEDDFTHLSTIIGYHDADNDRLTLLYPISKIEVKNAQTSFIQTHLPVSNPSIPSVTELFPGAYVYEREIKDFLGIDFNQNYKHLLLPDSFPKDVYPLLKDYSPDQLKTILTRAKVGLEPLKIQPDETDYSILIGPQHPTHKEPIRFKFVVTGEDIKDVDLRIGFNHRGIEKALEHGSWDKNLYLIERICGICSAAHQIAYVLAAEKAGGIVPPERAQWIRCLIGELERIHSHILWYGVLAHDAGYDMMFHVTWRDRELVMDALEEFSGNRVNYSMMTLGGVRRDLTSEQTESMREKLKELRVRVEDHRNILLSEKTFIARMMGIGILSRSEVIKLNAVGPTARGSNLDVDLRRDYPYAAYADIPFNVHTDTRGDVLASLKVRLDETIESIDMCLYILDNIPSGDIAVKIPKRLPEGAAHIRVEAPRGEDIHFVKSTGGNAPYRHKIRAPTLANISSLLHRFKKMQIADIPMIIRLIDPCIGCMERVTFVDEESSKMVEMSGKELIYRANKKYTENKQILLFR